MLDLIIDNDDGNQKVESKRGKLFRAPPEEAEVIEDVLDVPETDGNGADEADLDVASGIVEEKALAESLGSYLV